MTGTGEGYSLDSDPTEEQGSGDFIGLAYHGYTVTHVDAPSHIFMSGRMYNGLPSTVVNSTQGATAGSIELIADGIVTRCVLLDIARLRGVDWMAPGEAIIVDELERAEAEQNVRVEEGDVLLVRTGGLRYRNEVGPRPVEDGKPGLHASCLPWLRERGVAMLGSDAIQDVQPSGYPNFRQPIHRIGITHMGLWLIDNCNLEGRRRRMCGAQPLAVHVVHRPPAYQIRYGLSCKSDCGVLTRRPPPEFRGGIVWL